MPDITMCCNYDCPFKSKCYRYRAVPDPDWQSFAYFKPTIVNIEGGMATQCHHQWMVDEAKDRLLPTEVVDNRYERDSKWRGIK